MQREIRQSEIKAFKTCRRNWMLSYQRHLGIKVDDEGSKAKLGTLIHKGLEGYYGHGRPATEAAENFWMLLTPERQADKKLKSRYEYAKAMLAGYEFWVAETGADVGWEVVATEREMTIPFTDILGDEVTITCHLDLEIIDGYGIPRNVDHKSVASLENDRILAVDDQLLTYATSRSLLEGVAGVNAAMHNRIKRSKHTARATPPFYARQEVTFNEIQMKNHLQHMTQVITEMVTLAQYLEGGGDPQAAYPNPGKDCSWRCPFIGVCPMFDDGSDAEGFLSTYYEIKSDTIPGELETEEEE